MQDINPKSSKMSNQTAKLNESIAIVEAVEWESFYLAKTKVLDLRTEHPEGI